MPPKVRNVDQILAELDPAFNPQKQLIQKQQAALPGQQAAARQRLEGEQRNAFGEINRNANRRGLNFSGIPIAEQADFTSDVFLPGLTDLENNTRQQGFALEAALNDIVARQREQALSIREREQDRLFAFEQEQRAAERARRAAAAQAAQTASLFAAQNAGAVDNSAVEAEIRQADQSISQRERQILANIVQKGGNALDFSVRALESQSANGDLRATLKLNILQELQNQRKTSRQGLRNSQIVSDGGNNFSQVFMANF